MINYSSEYLQIYYDDIEIKKNSLYSFEESMMKIEEGIKCNLRIADTSYIDHSYECIQNYQDNSMKYKRDQEE